MAERVPQLEEAGEDIQGIAHAHDHLVAAEGQGIGHVHGVVGFDDPDALIYDVFATHAEHLLHGGGGKGHVGPRLDAGDEVEVLAQERVTGPGVGCVGDSLAGRERLPVEEATLPV